jgi:non-ribosomal peptide synthetase component F
VERTILGGSPVQLTIPGAVTWAAREFGGAGRAGTGRARLSYRELGEQVTAVAAALIEGGLAPGDRVAVWAPHNAEVSGHSLAGLDARGMREAAPS